MPDVPAEIILVDDHEDTRELAAEFLRMEGLEVAAYETAEQALASIAARLPAAIVTDVRLPGMSGEELAAAMRADPRTARLPILAVSGNDRGAVAKNLFDRILTKPIDPMDLVTAIRQAVQASAAGASGPG